MSYFLNRLCKSNVDIDIDFNRKHVAVTSLILSLAYQEVERETERNLAEPNEMEKRFLL